MFLLQLPRSVHSKNAIILIALRVSITVNHDSFLIVSRIPAALPAANTCVTELQDVSALDKVGRSTDLSCQIVEEVPLSTVLSPSCQQKTPFREVSADVILSESSGESGPKVSEEMTTSSLIAVEVISEPKGERKYQKRSSHNGVHTGARAKHVKSILTALYCRHFYW